MNSSEPLKRCTLCRHEFIRSGVHFHKDRSSKDKLNHRCKSCASTYVLELQKNKTYNSYRAAMERCRNPNHKDYGYYGGRGIEFKFKSWRELQEEIGPRLEGTSLDRIDTNGHYEVGNVKWSTAEEQAQNTVRNSFKKEEVVEMREQYKRGMTVGQLAVRWNKRSARICEIVHRKTWRNI